MKLGYYFLIINLSLIFAISAFAKEEPSQQRYLIIEHENPLPISQEKFFDKEDKPHILEEFENTTVLLNFWATWCTFCTSKMKSLDQLQKSFKKEPFKIIAISQDFKGIAVVAKFYEKKNIKNLDIFLDKKNKLFQAFNVVALPTSIIINPDGYEVARIVGVADWENDNNLKKLITKYINK